MAIDFYILEGTTGQKSLFFACRLIEKAYADARSVFIHTESRQDAERLDALLWTYKEDSFLPHQLYDPLHDFPPPIQIGYGDKPIIPSDLLINLSSEIPDFYSQFNQVIEIVFADQHVQQLARERYRQYRDYGQQINTHKLKVSEI